MEITMFELPTCPYCRQAKEIIAELYKENPSFSVIKIKHINELENKEMSEEYDYYYVPSFFLEKQKLYEADSSDTREKAKLKLKKMFEDLLKLE
ncbi:MAG: thioredoxin family protein [Bacilli bacterium]|nr:thioredoxin family protein [Bacilli bacterium]